MTPFLLEPGEDMRLEDVRVEDVRVYGEGQGELIRLRPVVNQYMRKKVPGFIRDVHFKNLQVQGKAGPYQVQLAGADAEHDVRNVTFENISILGAACARFTARERRPARRGSGIQRPAGRPRAETARNRPVGIARKRSGLLSIARLYGMIFSWAAVSSRT